ncbi:MAG: hypothetical protein IGBAC_2148 [Ignavibacteriae bacterium]|nr:MAG: hypothetical protein IGBAC_2148 [Ignavibacteriota bacterium]
MKKYLRFIKIEHTLFSLPLIYAGVLLATEKTPDIELLILVLTAAVGARIVAMSLNRIIDVKIDQKNIRTSSRELPAGRMKFLEAIVVTLLGLTVYAISAYLISKFCFYLSPIPLVIFLIYPYLKRFTRFAHFGVGLGLSMAPLGGWFAVKGSFEDLHLGILLPIFTIFWATGFDIIYSTLDEEFDRKEGLYSLPSTIGTLKALKVSAILHFLAFVMLIIIYIVLLRNISSLPFLIFSGYLLYLEQKKASDVELAFFKINAIIGFVVFLMVFMKGIKL